MPPEPRPEIEGLSSVEVYRNRWMRVREDQIRRADGSEGIYAVVEKKDFVVIAALDGDELVLVEQYRYPVGARHWEFPQGSWESGEISPEDLARAELREETGFEARSVVPLGHLFMAYGYSNQGYNIFLATGLVPGSTNLDPEEVGLVSRKFSVAEVRTKILDGTIQDATTVAVFGLLVMKGFLT